MIELVIERMLPDSSRYVKLLTCFVGTKVPKHTGGRVIAIAIQSFIYSIIDKWPSQKNYPRKNKNRTATEKNIR